MNNVLELRGNRFSQSTKNGNSGGIAMNSKKVVSSDHLVKLRLELEQIKKFWEIEQKFFNGIIISVYYNKIVAKSNRISGLFKKERSNAAIVGAKFNKGKDKHIITYFLNIQDLEKSIKLLCQTENVLKQKFNNSINKRIFDDNNIIDKISFEDFKISKSVFKKVVADVSYVDHFEIEQPEIEFKESIITLYNTGIDIKILFQNIGMNVLISRILDNQTALLDENQVKILFEKAPYLISMGTVNLSDLSFHDFLQKKQKEMIEIPDPNIEPTIGVIDTLFDEQVYFSKWVEYHDMVDNEFEKNSNDYRHGTAISSIIVDGPKLNPWLDDGCGRFKVRHFGVALGNKFSSFTIIKTIKQIIASNKDIKVWNLSLGSAQEINDNFISAEASVLDRIQYENDVIFVVAGTNKPNETIDKMKIGSPADSINSIVVNAVAQDKKSTNYSRRGLALSFFAKPDVSYYGGSKEQYIQVCEPLGKANVAGTSYAAPWIARKLSYLIDIIGLNREIAKAMIIDAARGWDDKPTPEKVSLYGHGIVPIKITDIIQTKDDEIKFIVSDISEKWNTYNYNFPIPMKDDKYPYNVKATMTYFPLCDRAQGVDYTNTELNLHFGRIQNNGKIKDIKGDKQNQNDSFDDEKYYILENKARIRFRKWDNVKYISENINKKMTPKESYVTKKWGMEIKTNNRLDPQDGIGVRFGVIVTLKEMNGVNRIDEFTKNCSSSGWLVKPIDVEQRIEIYKKTNENIKF